MIYLPLEIDHRRPMRNPEPLHCAAPLPPNRRAWLAHAGLRAVGLMALGHWGTVAHAQNGGKARNLDALWNFEVVSLDGAAHTLRKFQGQPLLLNFWASWCAPCIEELPLLSRFSRQLAAKGWRFAGIAVDTAPNVKRFLARAPVSFEVVIAGSRGLRLSQTLGNTAGGLPYTLVVNSKGEIVGGVSGLVSERHLRDWEKTVG